MSEIKIEPISPMLFEKKKNMAGQREGRQAVPEKDRLAPDGQTPPMPLHRAVAIFFI